MHNFQLLVPSHEKSHAYTHCRTKDLNFSVGTRNHDKNWTEKKFNHSDFNNIPAIEIIIM